MILIDAVRKKLLGKQIYLDCKNKKLNVDDNILQKRLQYLHGKGFVKNWNLDDLINFCKLKKDIRFNMDGEFELKVEDDYFPSIPEEKKEEEEEWELVEDDIEYTDERAELEHDEPYEMILLQDNDCRMSKVLESLYGLLIMRGVCFLQGTFVFADDNGDLFKRLLHKCTYNYRRGIARSISHDIFINPEEFNKRDKDSKLDKNFLKTQQIYYPNAVNFKFYMYEVPIQDVNKKEFEFNYACDPECRNDESKCSEDLKETKRIILFYPFQVVHYPKGGKRKIVKRYLYMKLEDSHAVSTTHAVSAFKAYVLPIFFGRPKTEKKYPIRRERKLPKEVSYSDTNFPEIDNIFYQELNSDLQEVLFYNMHVRNHYEMFIPQNITNGLLDELP